MSQTKLPQTDAEWRAWLIAKNAEPLAFEVTRRAATERPYSGKYETHWEHGQYNCVCCDAKLFDSSTKFDAGCGWPSFYQSAEPDASPKKSIAVMAWCELRVFALNVVLTWAMFLRMVLSRRVFVTA